MTDEERNKAWMKYWEENKFRDCKLWDRDMNEDVCYKTIAETCFIDGFEAGQKAMIEVIKRMVEKHGSFDYFEEEFNDFVKEFEGDKDE